MSKPIFIGLVIGLLAVIGLSQTMVSNASIQNNSSGSNESSNGTSAPNQAIEHINQAQAALQNGDTEGANNHLELAKSIIVTNFSGRDIPIDVGKVPPR